MISGNSKGVNNRHVWIGSRLQVWERAAMDIAPLWLLHTKIWEGCNGHHIFVASHRKSLMGQLWEPAGEYRIAELRNKQKSHSKYFVKHCICII